MTSEFEPRAGHDVVYVRTREGKTERAWLYVNERGICEVTEELMDQLFTEVGFEGQRAEGLRHDG